MDLFEIEIKDGYHQTQTLKPYQGNVLLIVNTATDCEFTGQYDELEDLYEKYHDQGFYVLDFPCNQFGEQAPGNMEEIMSFCADTYGVSFPQFEKIDVNGENECLIFTYLKDHQDPQLSKRIEWNFTKFLVDRQGHVVKRFAPNVSPYEIEEYIEEVL